MLPESRNGQNAPDTGGEIDTLPKGGARITVDVGQHSGETAQTSSDQAGGRLETETVGESSDGNAGSGAASDVLLKIAQVQLRREKYREGYRILAFGGRAIFCKSEG